jgi:hypothetical protein
MHVNKVSHVTTIKQVAADLGGMHPMITAF